MPLYFHFSLLLQTRLCPEFLEINSPFHFHIFTLTLTLTRNDPESFEEIGFFASSEFLYFFVFILLIIIVNRFNIVSYFQKLILKFLGKLCQLSQNSFSPPSICFFITGYFLISHWSEVKSIHWIHFLGITNTNTNNHLIG